MTRNEKACPMTAITEQAEAAVLGGAAASCKFNVTTRAKLRQVADVLLFGAENAIDGATLAATLGYKSRRDLSKQIERERRNGQPICAAVAGDRRGYYLAATPDEFSSYIRSLDRRIREVRRTRDACGETLRRMTGQETLQGW